MGAEAAGIGGDDPRKQAYNLLGTLIEEAKDRVEFQEKLKSLQDEIRSLDGEIEKEHDELNFNKELQLNVAKDACKSDISEIEQVYLLVIDGKIDKLLSQLGRVSLQDPKDQAAIENIKDAFANRDQINEQTIVDLTKLQDTFKP